MIFFGLHILDWLVLGLYFAAMIAIGRLTSASVHGQQDFFLAGRKLGRFFQICLNFGNMTDASGAVRASSIVYSQGVGGVWLLFQTLFMTPYYWFMNAWFRRVRLTTVADLFRDRFGGKFLGALYAVFAIGNNIIAMGGGYLVTYKVLEIFIVKPESAYSVAEAGMVRDFKEFSTLQAAYREGRLLDGGQSRYRELKGQFDRGKIKSYVSYVNPLTVCLSFAIVVGIYVIMGGMTAAAITDAFQGILIVVFSIMLIPFGLWNLGGLKSFHEKIPDRMLDLFGSDAVSEFSWYSIAAILFVSIVQIHAGSGNMAISGSARDEAAASIGAVSGGFIKRGMIIAWCFCGLLAFAIFGGGISDPDTVWGSLCHALLGPGVFGLMLVGLIAAEMSTLSSQCLTLSALFVRNIYLVIWPNRTEKEGLFLARVLVGVALFSAIGVALFVDDLLAFTKMQLTLNVAFGAAILVIFKWRRITKVGVTFAVIVSLLAIVVIPFAGSLIPAIRQAPSLHLQTNEKRESHSRRATAEDVLAGRAAAADELIEKTTVTAPKAIFFDRLVADGSVMQGGGRFNFELFLLSKAGVDLSKLNPAQLLALTYTFDGLLPLFLLVLASLLTRETRPDQALRFYAKMRTPVVPDPQEDASRLAQALADPATSEDRKLFPGSQWEFLRWSRQDLIAFPVCCVIAVAILFTFAGLLQLGRS